MGETSDRDYPGCPPEVDVRELFVVSPFPFGIVDIDPDKINCGGLENKILEEIEDEN